jgi:DNA polymerase-3 subunit epsilon
MICFVDIETTGLDPERHEIWEIGIVLGNGLEREYQLPVTLLHAEARALEIGGFLERHMPSETEDVEDARRFLLNDLSGHVFVGNNPQFDAAFLSRFLGSAPWHYHLVDVKALCAGRLAAGRRQTPPWSTAALLEAAGLPSETAHTALADAKQAKAMYDWAMR